MSENMAVYERVRAVPPEALKSINGGRLKGMSDINPMWRIKMLTEVFGLCGIGWKTEIVEKRLEQGSGNEVVCFVDINLYVKVDGEWSAPIPGMGGSSFVTQEKNGPYTSDECFKMAYTDAISVACKSLGFAADVYFAKDRTKYSDKEDQSADGNEDRNKIERASKLNVVLNKWKVLSGEKDDAKARESFNDFLQAKNETIEHISFVSLVEIEKMLTKRLLEKNEKKGEAAIA